MRTKCKMQNVKCKIRGFTLIELIIVVGVVSVLSIALLTIVDPVAQFQKANDARRKSDLSQIQKTLESYYGDNGRYPAGDATYQILRLDGNPVTKSDQSWIPYMEIVPFDADNLRRYVYYVNSNGQAYWLYASLERGGKDSQSCKGVSNACSGAPPESLIDFQTACGSVCNYGTSSPNVSP